MLVGLDLFSGIGGITLALNGWVRPACYCEIDKYAQSVLLSRIADGQLPRAPIWDDITSLNGSMLPNIDIIYGGFPCQDISSAGRGGGLEGKRSGLFFEILRLARETRPTFLFLENVAAIRTRGLGTVIHALAEIGYDCRWTMLSASDIGAPHKRERWFLLAHTKCEQLWNEQGRSSRSAGERSPEPGNDGQKEFMAHANGERLEGCGWKESKFNRSSKSRKDNECKGSWTTEPNVGRVVNGLSHRVDRIKGLGNSVVPLQAQEAFKYLMGL